MARRYLFGPATVAFANQNLSEQRQASECLVFKSTGEADLTIRPTDDWQCVCGILPVDWNPDFVVLYLPYSAIPACLWSAPVPVIGLAPDWNLLWRSYRHQLPGCDLIFTDTSGVEALRAEGITNVRAANLFGLERAFLEHPWADEARDIDILFVGNLSGAVQRERLPWLGVVASGEWRVAGVVVSGEWRGVRDKRSVVIQQGVFGEEYRKLLGRARIVFNRSIRGECNKRTFEAAAAGALLFQEAGNREVGDYFRDRQECVFYTEDNLEELLEYYLEHEDERRLIAEAARLKVQEYSFEKLWDQHLKIIEEEWPALLERAQERCRRGKAPSLQARLWQTLSSGEPADANLPADLAAALVVEPKSASLHNALGLATAAAEQGHVPSATLAQTAAGYFERAVACDPTHVMAGLNLAEALAISGQPQAAIERALRTLDVLNRQSEGNERAAIGCRSGFQPDRTDWKSVLRRCGVTHGDLDTASMDAGHFPLGFDLFRVEWERAAWSNAGRPHSEARSKSDLIRWRLQALLGSLTGAVHHYYEAAILRPDLPVTRAALGCALARAKQFPAAVPHLRFAVAGNPFDLDAARALFEVLGDVSDQDGQRRLAADRRLLSRSAAKAVPAEKWFMDCPPAEDELASIIILCCNQLEYTRLCLESVLRHTRQPYELILIDNGSTDDTAAYLGEVASGEWRVARDAGGPERVVVIRNETNVGFPAGCNQGLAEARGRYLVFLNNDTVVTEEWLSGLVGWALHDWPEVGLVGAVTNYASPPQQIPVPYKDLTGVDGFAARRRSEFANQALRVDRLTGFCLLVRSEVLERIGGFDERYGLGFFDDDDLCVRAREAGFRLLVAQNVFIHHFGSRTFTSLGIDCERQLKENFDQFKAKWGDGHAAGYRVRGEGIGNRDEGNGNRGEGVGGMRVSLTMIVKNEEENLPACLATAADLVDEVVVVDTGSTDRTKDVAMRLGARVFDFSWVDSFAAARNAALSHASGDWIFWLDADDRLDEENRANLRALFAELKDENVAYGMKCHCFPDPESSTATIVDHVRLFRNLPEIRWRYRVHEQILPAVRHSGGNVLASDVVIHHVGYEDPKLRVSKEQRNLRLLLLDHAEEPSDPFTLFNLGWTYAESGRPEEALPYLRGSLERSHPGDSIVRKLYTLIMSCLKQLDQRQDALAICTEGRRFYPDDAQLLFQEAVLRQEEQDLDGAEACLLRLLGTQEGPHFASVAEGIRGYLARHNLAVIHREQGRNAEAEAQWLAALQEQPKFTPARLGLAELYLKQGRQQDLEKHLQTLEASSNGASSQAFIGVTALRARTHLARKEFAQARQILDEAIARTPRETILWEVLSHALLQEGKDLARAEQALRTVLELQPANPEAPRNLEILLKDERRYAGSHA